MQDISPELLQKIRASFKGFLEADEKGKQLLDAIEKGATYEQAGDYAECVGNALAKAFRDNLSSAVLPDGKMYWNIAQNVISPLLHDDYDLCVKAAMQAQKRINDASGIGIKPKAADFNEDRANDIFNKIATAERFDDVSDSLQRAVQNFSRGVVDDTLKSNADFQAKLGLRPVIIRKVNGRCCEWCSAMEGIYQYPDNVPKDVYRRHDNCRCSVDYKPDQNSKTVQNVHSKQLVDEKTLEERKITGIRQPTTAETKAERERIGLLGKDKRRPTVDNSGNGGIIKIGGISGALEPSSKEAEEHAVQYYASVRKMKYDVIAISENTGFSVEEITSIKNYVFLQKHDLGGDTPEYFVPSYDMAQTWQRLIDGKNIQKHDLTLLKHESIEKELISRGKKQEEAHLIASAKYNYSMEVREYNDKIAKHSKK